MAAMETTWKRFFPQTPFEYTFLDENFDKLYQSEQRQATIFTSSSRALPYLSPVLAYSVYPHSQFHNV